MIESFDIRAREEDMTEVYEEIALMAEQLVRDSYEAIGKKSVDFPINAEIIAKYLGVEVKWGNLNLVRTSGINKKLGVTAYNGKNVEITVDNSAGDKMRRYVIANGIGRYLLNGSRYINKTSYAIPLIPRSMDDFIADAIAVFLLMPITKFKDEFLEYIYDHGERPIDSDAWLEHLNNRCQIPLFNLASGYQQMKMVLCYQRQKKFEECGYDPTKMEGDKYDIIYA